MTDEDGVVEVETLEVQRERIKRILSIGTDEEVRGLKGSDALMAYFVIRYDLCGGRHVSTWAGEFEIPLRKSSFVNDSVTRLFKKIPEHATKRLIELLCKESLGHIIESADEHGMLSSENSIRNDTDMQVAFTELGQRMARFKQGDATRFDREDKKDERTWFLKKEIVVKAYTIIGEEASALWLSKRLRSEYDEETGITTAYVSAKSKFDDIIEWLKDADSGKVMFSIEPDCKDIERSEHIKKTDDIQVLKADVRLSAHSAIREYILGHNFVCNSCGRRFFLPVEVSESYSGGIPCNGTIEIGEGEETRFTQCRDRQKCVDSRAVSLSVFCYTATVIYNGMERSLEIYSLKEIKGADCELYGYVKITPKTCEMFVMNVEEPPRPVFEMPELTGTKNALIEIVEAIDKKLGEHGVHIEGLLPMKIAMLIQAINKYCGNHEPDIHIQFIGKAATGKTTLMREYGRFLYGNKFVFLSGNNVSKSGLFGTEAFPGSLPTVGLANIYDFVVIDEMAADNDLRETIKTNLSEDAVASGKMNSDGNPVRRTAQFGFSENPSYKHANRYAKNVEKNFLSIPFRKFNEKDIGFFDPDVNKNMHITHYIDDPAMLWSVVKSRKHVEGNNTSWVDGNSLPLTSRMPLSFVFEFVDRKQYKEHTLKYHKPVERVDNTNVTKNVRTYFDTAPFWRQMRERMKEHNIIDEESQTRYNQIVTTLLEEQAYNMEHIARGAKIWDRILLFSASFNGHDTITESDMQFVKYLISLSRNGIDISNIPPVDDNMLSENTAAAFRTFSAFDKKVNEVGATAFNSDEGTLRDDFS